MDMYQPATLLSRPPMPSGAPLLDGAGVAARGRGMSDGAVGGRPVGDPRRDVIVELGAGRGTQGLAALDRLSALDRGGLYQADGRVSRPADIAQPGSEARMRGALEELGLSQGEVEDFLQVSRMLARISPDAARRLEEGLRAMAEAAATGGRGGAANLGDAGLGPMERLGGRNGYALDYMRLEFSYTEVTETVVHGSDGSVRTELSATQIDLSFERLEVAFRGKSDDVPAFLTLDGEALSFGAEPAAQTEGLTEIDVEAAGLRALLDALSAFRSQDQDDRKEHDERFGLRIPFPGSRAR